jgi:hypothetical protein
MVVKRAVVVVLLVKNVTPRRVDAKPLEPVDEEAWFAWIANIALALEEYSQRYDPRRASPAYVSQLPNCCFASLHEQRLIFWI